MGLWLEVVGMAALRVFSLQTHEIVRIILPNEGVLDDWIERLYHVFPTPQPPYSSGVLAPSGRVGLQMPRSRKQYNRLLALRADYAGLQERPKGTSLG